MKSEEMNRIIKELTGIDVNESIVTEVCATCQQPVTEFRDELSKKEFQISGMCQSCQDSVFGGGEEVIDMDDFNVDEVEWSEGLF